MSARHRRVPDKRMVLRAGSSRYLEPSTKTGKTCIGNRMSLIGTNVSRLLYSELMLKVGRLRWLSLDCVSNSGKTSLLLARLSSDNLDITADDEGLYLTLSRSRSNVHSYSTK